MVLLQRHRRQSKDERGKKILEKVNHSTGIFKLQEDFTAGYLFIFAMQVLTAQ